MLSTIAIAWCSTIETICQWLSVIVGFAAAYLWLMSAVPPSSTTFSISVARPDGDARWPDLQFTGPTVRLAVYDRRGLWSDTIGRWSNTTAEGAIDGKQVVVELRVCSVAHLFQS